MKIRMEDDEEQTAEIKHQRSNRDRWVQALIAVIAAVAAYLGGTTYVQMQDVQSNPAARADPFTGADGAVLEARLIDRIAEKADFNRARWDEIAKHLEVQRAVGEVLRSSIEQILSRCAQAQARFEGLQSQILDNRDEQRETRKLLYNHIGLNESAPHKK